MVDFRQWLYSTLVGVVMGSSLHIFFEHAGLAFVGGVVYTITTRAVLLQPAFVFGQKTSKQTGFWGGLSAGLVVFVLMSIESRLVPTADSGRIGLVIILFGFATAMGSLGMQYRESLDREISDGE